MKFMAILVVAIMVASAFIMLAPMAKAPAPAAEQAPVEMVPASTLAEPLNRQVAYTVSNIGESYLKDSRDVDGARGLHSSTPGLSEWWVKRKAAYSDTVIHDSYPYWVAYNPESSINDYTRVAHLAYGTFSYYRFSMDAKDIGNVATGPNQDPLYLPILGDIASDGGTVQLNWHLTYMTSEDVASALAGTSYVNTYYGVAPGDLVFGGWAANDGWYIEHSGKMTFDRAAAGKFLGLNAGATDMRLEFRSNNDALNTAWAGHYLAEASPDTIYDIYACYDFSINSGPVLYFLTEDPASTTDTLVLRMWGYSWGSECLMMRYLDVQGLMVNFEGWSEDYYFNATITSDRAQIQTRSTMAYHMTTWKDPSYWGASWMLEAQHYDYNDYDGPFWLSRFTPYMALAGYTPMRTQWEAGTNNIGSEVAFWNTPSVFDLASGESLTVKLPTGQSMGYMPYKGTVSDLFPKQGGGNDEKAVEMNTHQQWGEMVLGPGTFPSLLYSASYYNAATKTLKVNGPVSWARNPDSVFPDLNEGGSPMFMFDVSPVSEYNLSLPAGPYTVGVPYTLTVTARDLAGSAVATNFTVNLVGGPGVTLGATTHAYAPVEGGVWTTTVTFTTGGGKVITATDSRFTLDVTGSRTIPVDANRVNLVAGWNFLSVPRIGFGYKASTLGLMTGDVVAGYGSSTQTYTRSYTVGVSPAFKNFWILPSEGYWVFCGAAETLYLTGSTASGTQTRSVTVPAVGGWLIFGLASLTTTYKASSTPAWYTGGSITLVASYDPVTKVYKTWNPGAPAFKDFFLVPGQAYWIFVTASGAFNYPA